VRENKKPESLRLIVGVSTETSRFAYILREILSSLAIHIICTKERVVNGPRKLRVRSAMAQRSGVQERGGVRDSPECGGICGVFIAFNAQIRGATSREKRGSLAKQSNYRGTFSGRLAWIASVTSGSFPPLFRSHAAATAHPRVVPEIDELGMKTGQQRNVSGMVLRLAESHQSVEYQRFGKITVREQLIVADRE